MDAFYASVEQRDNPALRGRPVIVGGHARRGVVLAASYEVRPTGVRSAMPMARALKLAPDAVVAPPRFAAYAAASDKLFAILQSATPLVEPLSLDEAFLDVTASLRLFGAATDLAARLRRRIADEVGLPSSAGIAAVKFIAKIASDLAKPNGQREVPADDGVAFLAPLPIGRLWGVGPKTEQQLHALDIRTIGDVAARDVGWLERKLGSGGRDLWELAHGIDARPVIPDRDAKSIGAEDTFEEDLEGVEALRPHIHDQALRVGARLRRAGVRARTVQLKLKFSDFTLLTRRSTFAVATDDGQALYRTAMELLAGTALPRPVRLTGVSGQGLEATAAQQLSMFAPPAGPADRLNAALDSISARFGQGAVTTGDLAGSGAESGDRERLQVDGAAAAGDQLGDRLGGDRGQQDAVAKMPGGED
jgi:DNA polymerase-4